ECLTVFGEVDIVGELWRVQCHPVVRYPVASEGAVFFEDVGSDRDGGESGPGTQGVVGVADFFGHAGEGGDAGQVGVFRFAGVGEGAGEECDLAGFEPHEGPFDFVEVGGAGGQEDGFAGRGDLLEELTVGDVPGGDLVGGDVDGFEEIDSLKVERGGQKTHADDVAHGFEFLPFFGVQHAVGGEGVSLAVGAAEGGVPVAAGGGAGDPVRLEDLPFGPGAAGGLCNFGLFDGGVEVASVGLAPFSHNLNHSCAPYGADSGTVGLRRAGRRRGHASGSGSVPKRASM